MERKLDIGSVFSRIFEFYGQQFGLLLPAALIVLLPAAVVEAAIGDRGVGDAGDIPLVLLSIAATVILNFWYQGMVVQAVRDILDGRRDFSLGGLFRSVTPVLGVLIGAGILAGLGIAFGFLLLVVPGLLLLTWWALLGPVIVLERAGVGDAFRRSRALVRGNGWRVFAVIVLLGLLQTAVSTVFQGFANALSDSALLRALASLIGSALVAPLGALAASTMYFELKGTGGEDPTPGDPAPSTAAG